MRFTFTANVIIGILILIILITRLFIQIKEKVFFELSITDIGLLGLSIVFIKEGINTNKKPFEISFEEEWDQMKLHIYTSRLFQGSRILKN